MLNTDIILTVGEADIFGGHIVLEVDEAARALWRLDCPEHRCFAHGIADSGRNSRGR